MLKLSKLSDYAVITLCALDKQSDGPAAASVLSKQTHLPEPTIAKILKLLSAADLVSSTRGVKGGYVLAKPLSEISVKNVVNALDGPIVLTTCVETSTEDCPLASSCALHGRWDGVNTAIKTALASVMISDMVAFESMPVKQTKTNIEAAHV